MMETFSILSFMALRRPLCLFALRGRLDAAVRLRDARDLRGGLGRTLREQLVQLLHADPRGLAEDPDRGSGALGGVLGAHARQDLPVPVGQLGDPEAPRDL